MGVFSEQAARSLALCRHVPSRTPPCATQVSGWLLFQSGHQTHRGEMTCPRLCSRGHTLWLQSLGSSQDILLLGVLHAALVQPVPCVPKARGPSSGSASHTESLLPIPLLSLALSMAVGRLRGRGLPLSTFLVTICVDWIVSPQIHRLPPSPPTRPYSGMGLLRRKVRLKEALRVGPSSDRTGILRKSRRDTRHLLLPPPQMRTEKRLGEDTVRRWLSTS